ncbi:hypothetical protein Pla22_35070 [Rubripirellula amarantea]|uniref:DUF2007 domain-containing protein n=1 Tax=Rubripirellula amarantea TaxID=2527999 RepID=A0A5C5WIW2_9BACT|nr:hypothetical protein [Rubripirellula amarantea]TWT50764.1 hypothetical protein Pla22_35070 [Rubripirellula amarantea]
MNQNPYQPPSDSESSQPAKNLNSEDHDIPSPVLAYTATGNLAAHSIVTWLEYHGVQAYAVEDHSTVGVGIFGTVSQTHKPQVFVDQSDLDQATVLLRQYEQQRVERQKELADAPPITAECEECGESSEFPAIEDGTTQTCPKCYKFMDVGELDWPEDFYFDESESKAIVHNNVEDAIDAAANLDSRGDWDEAIIAYSEAATQWPEHATYINNCILEIQNKRDAAR